MNDTSRPVIAIDTPLGGDLDVLAEIFRAAEKPPERWRIGAEAEKFGVDATTGAPLQYEGERGVVRVLESLASNYGWSPVREVEGGPIVSLTRDQSSVTLEPGSQLELSGAPLNDVHEVCAELRGHLAELGDISKEMGLVWLGVGFHPVARQDDLSWVPKQRYRVMREYLPTKGPRALDMMRRTATVQANYDFSSEEDAMRKLRLGLVVSPLVHAMTANSPFLEGRLAGKKSVRGEVWLGMDPQRSGLIPPLWTKRRATYRDYVEWALDAGMFLFKRNGRVFDNRGQSFRSFIEDGFEGERATYGDWTLHLNTLFPEARLKSTLEVRSCDSLPANLACALPALFAGIFYDERALAQAEELVAALELDAVEQSRPALVAKGLDAEMAGKPVRDFAVALLDIASGGLERRNRLSASGKDERIHLERLTELNQKGRVPADVLTEGLEDDESPKTSEILARTRF